MKQSRRKFVKTGIGGLASIGALNVPLFGLMSCSSEDPEVPENNGLGITGVSLPTAIDVPAGSEISFNGKGFKVGDQIKWTSTSDATIKFLTTIAAVGPASASLLLPDEINSGSYRLVLSRGGETLPLGTLQLNLVTDMNIPDKEGMSVKGIVYCNGLGLAGVVVSDGHEVTTTDADGIYYLASDKKSGAVFISIPGNYEVPTNGNAPQFFKRFSKDASSVEQHDFSLIEADNDQ